MVFAGDSAGGNLLLATLLELRDTGRPLPTAVVVLSALTDLTYSGRSRGFNKWRDPMLPVGRGSGMHDMYLNGSSPRNPLVSPLLGHLGGLPPILGQVGSTEILLSDTTRLSERARAAGTPFYLEIWKGMPHVWHAHSFLPESQAAISRIAQFIKSGKLSAPVSEATAWPGAYLARFKHRPSFTWAYYDGKEKLSVPESHKTEADTQ